ncbi:Eco57I restriction-modification methylase domain-containing protein [Leucobacter luti]|uniref:site-specific DNA-methyltransferase (adenine-specific) n=1 Tax=Leucobacter luti TaxID=340320 RepID=A0A4Q7U8Z5_9MICO|nr:DNA methyltransferase [Leucobacter luti]RZT68858.1 type II restriction/modification system DNA methylase subunit YeeA [Leucobacter luti]
MSDAFIIGEDWISEHFFTTDAKSQSFGAEVLSRRKEWDGHADEGLASVRQSVLGVRERLVRELALLEEGAGAQAVVESVYEPLRMALGYAGGGASERVSGPLRLLSPAGEELPALALIEARPVAAVDELLEKHEPTLREPYHPEDDENHPIESVSRLLSHLFVADDAPAFALVFAGGRMLLAERERWAEGRYLGIDLQLALDRNETKRAGELDRLIACVSAEALLPRADGETWWARVLEESIKHTVGVSQDLRDGVRESIEILANEVVARRRELGLAPLPADQAPVLATQTLRYLYRILFLLFAEASPELGVLPAQASTYEEGYSLDRLRELLQVELSHGAAQGTHLYESLGLLFRLVEQGYHPETDEDATSDEGLTFHSLRADLFRPAAVALIDEVGLGDSQLQRVLTNLLLTKQKSGSDRGYISYANLGINQLGSVYEGLMSYSGFFAETDLYEVAKGGDSGKGSWVVPVARSHDIEPNDFVREREPDTGEERPVLHPVGSFVYRLAGRERQQSASYYTPEVLTRFTVSQALAELLDQDGQTTAADDILTLRICEPALGSGAFAIEAVRQLAAEYLSRKQEETGQRVDPDNYPQELQRVKASLALHQVYGVDLNSTAVELAEISLWLDTMVAGLNAPWFGLHLKRGNSLIGARRAVYSMQQIETKSWLKAVPRDVPVAELAENLASGRLSSGTSGAVHHFLLPAAGWGSAAGAKEAKVLAPDAAKALAAWQRSTAVKPTPKQLKQLRNLSSRVEKLWQLSLRRLEIAEDEVRRAIPLWGQAEQARVDGARAVTREEIERKLGEPAGAYQRLRRVMDAWNALWFWPLTDTLTDRVSPPSMDEWLAGLRALLGEHTEISGAAAKHGQTTLATEASGWEELNDLEIDDLAFAAASSIPQALREHPWLAVTERIAAQQGFFHWELDFATVFARGGFDLQVGNPPWVRPDFDETASLAEHDVWWALNPKPAMEEATSRKQQTLAEGAAERAFLDDLTGVIGTRESVSHVTRFPMLSGLRPDLYRCFMEQTWRNNATSGIVGLIHPETHFTDENAGLLRGSTYRKLRRHWQFINELSLFEIHHLVSYGVHIYGAESVVGFDMATSLYHPETVTRSYAHSGEGAEPGLKDGSGNWDQSPHRNRIIRVTEDTLRTWHAILEGATVPPANTRMVYAVNEATAQVLDKLSKAPRLGQLPLETSQGWNETTDFKAGFFEKRWGPADSWDEAILQGPHLFVGNPFYKAPNSTMRNNSDWSAVDLETLAPDALPVTAYKPAAERQRYDAAYTHWGDDRVPARDHYRIAWRNMAANTGERTLIPAIIPPGAAQINAVTALGFKAGKHAELLELSGSLSSLLNDFLIRSAPKSTITAKTIMRLAHPTGAPLGLELSLRASLLNSLTQEYGALHGALKRGSTCTDWAGGIEYLGRQSLLSRTGPWGMDTPLRRDSDRYQALVEIDAIVALRLGVTADELCTIYRTQFPVLYGYDRNAYFYDANGRLVPKGVLAIWKKRGDAITEMERTETNASGYTYVYELPFITLDREADMRQAYAHFERVLEERS